MEVLLSCLHVLPLVEVQQGIVGSVCHSDGRLQFVGDVVGEVALHFVERLLFQQCVDEIPEREAEDDEREGGTGKVV